MHDNHINKIAETGPALTQMDSFEYWVLCEYHCKTPQPQDRENLFVVFWFVTVVRVIQ